MAIKSSYFKTPKVAQSPITQEGLDNLKKDLENYIGMRPAAVVNLRTAREMGDLSENAAYHAARSQLSSIDFHIRRLTHQIKISKVVSNIDDGTVQIGRKVGVQIGTIKKEFSIVGGYESNPLEGKISCFSPIGKALMNKRMGDSVDVTTPSGIVTYTITSVT
jgi:transcription elongation factor GreA